MDFDEALKALGINTHGVRYDEMSKDERATLDSWLQSLSKSQLTLDKVKVFIHQMRDAIEIEFMKVDLTPNQEIFLKARLKNIMLIESFLLGPERAKKALEQMLKGVK